MLLSCDGFCDTLALTFLHSGGTRTRGLLPCTTASCPSSSGGQCAATPRSCSSSHPDSVARVPFSVQEGRGEGEMQACFTLEASRVSSLCVSVGDADGDATRDASGVTRLDACARTLLAVVRSPRAGSHLVRIHTRCEPELFTLTCFRLC